MYQAPDLPVPTVVVVFPEKAKALWLRALARPEVELRSRAAEAITLARRRGVNGLETTVAPLQDALDRADQHPAVRLAVAQALITLNTRSAAASLFKHAQLGSSDLRELVEPALAQWDYPPARAEWLARLGEPATPYRSLVLAIRGLSAVREAQAADRLREIVRDERRPGPIRLEAARALGLLCQTGLEKDAQALAADPSPRGLAARLAAASLLRRHTGAEAVRLLEQLARDPEPAVAALGAARLSEIDPKLVVPALDHLLASSDAKVRSVAVDVLRRLPTAERLRRLSDCLDDVHPAVRVQARRALHELAVQKTLRQQVIEHATRVLGGRRWRALEQGTILLTQLDHKPVADRLLELLRFERPEVFITAAWGLRKLAVPRTLPLVLRYVEAQEAHVRDATVAGRSDVPIDLLDHQLAQLNQFLGGHKHAAADAVLRRFVPRMGKAMRGTECPESRAAAIWALGVIHEGQTVPALATALEERLNDGPPSIPPEDERVRRMAAVTLGRIRAEGALPSLHHYCPDFKPGANAVHNACGWAIGQITGKAMPPPETIRRVQRDWFLTPNE
jgi:HEAT repeat protein